MLDDSNIGKNNNLSIRIEGGVQTLTLGQHHFEIFYPGERSMEIPMGNPVFVGYGIHEPGLGWDDYEGLDIKDRLVMIIAGFPNNSNRGVAFPSELRQKYSDRRNGDFRRFSNVVEMGAAGMIVIPDQNIMNNWETIMAERRRSNLVPVENYGPFSPGETSIPTIVIHSDLVNRLFKNEDFNPITHKGDYKTKLMNDIELSLSIDVKKESIDCYNVIGIIPGTDPELGKEYITVFNDFS